MGNIQREEFEDLIRELESFRDIMLDSVSKMNQDIEELKNEIEDLRDVLKERKVEIDSRQRRL